MIKNKKSLGVFILVVLIIALVLVFFNPLKNVTSEWNGVVLEQTSPNSPTNYILTFNEHSLVIGDDYGNFVGYDSNLSEEKREELLKKFKVKKATLVAGEYTEYSVKKKDDNYTISAIGQESFTYTIKKLAPRKFIGEEGIEYSTGVYVE